MKTGSKVLITLFLTASVLLLETETTPNLMGFT